MQTIDTHNLPIRLNLGCGQFPISGFLNVDFDKASKADLLLNLNEPSSYTSLPSNHFETIVIDHVLEHLDRPFEVMKELHRILKPNGTLEVRVPHFSRAMTHPEHAHGFDVTFPEYLNPRFKGGYIGVAFTLVRMRLDYMIRWDLKEQVIPRWQTKLLKPLNATINAFANAQPYACSRFWCYIVGGFEQIEFIFKKEKV